MMEESQIEPLLASYHRCRGNGDFIGTFYDIFLSKSKDVADQFGNTDFENQKLMLRQSLLTMLCFELGMPRARDEIVKIGRRHKDLMITEEMYALWLDSLCETVQRHDPKITSELENRWREAMLKGIEVMLSVDRESKE